MLLSMSERSEPLLAAADSTFSQQTLHRGYTFTTLRRHHMLLFYFVRARTRSLLVLFHLPQLHKFSCCCFILIFLKCYLIYFTFVII
jgi:hypothetical protein